MRYTIVFILFFILTFVTHTILAQSLIKNILINRFAPSQLPKCELKNNKLIRKNCFGSFILPSNETFLNGKEYTGDWGEKVPHGHGIMIYLDGMKYDGNWVNGKRDGLGTLTYPNGRKVHGRFNDGIFGFGIYKYKNVMDIWDGILFWYYKVVK